MSDWITNDNGGKIHISATVHGGATVGERATVHERATVGEWATVMAGATVREGATVDTLRITARPYSITAMSTGLICIGCEHHDVAVWQRDAEAIGGRHYMNHDRIAEYQGYIALCAAWIDGHAAREKAAEVTT